MRRCVLMTLMLVACAGMIAAQEEQAGMGGYDSMDIEAGFFAGTFDGRIDLLRDGVKIRLLSEDPEKADLPISANTMKFEWPEGEGDTPTRILLEGKVVIEHPQAGTVRSEKADWDFTKELLTITGNPVLSSERVPELKGEKFVLSFADGRFEVYGFRAKEMPLSGAGEGTEAAGSGATGTLSVSDVKDWPGFVDRLKAQAAADEPSPGKQVFGLLDSKVQSFLTSLPTETLLEDKEALLKQINKVMVSPKLYDEKAWDGVEIGEAAQALLDKAGRSQAEQVKLNRALLEAAYPGFIEQQAQ